MHDIRQVIRPTRLAYAVSLAVASLMAGQAALAQDTTPPQDATNAQAQGAGATAAPQGNQEIASGIATVVVSTRKSQQSSIARKKNAATAI
ncbi:MAG: hypothetical protein ACJ8HJ_31225, partial [Massilia sp.]